VNLIIKGFSLSKKAHAYPPKADNQNERLLRYPHRKQEKSASESLLGSGCGTGSAKNKGDPLNGMIHLHAVLGVAEPP
jgi:hypothetical protein